MVQHQGITAEEIRIYCRDYYVIPARKKNEKQITIRVGDVHKILGLSGRYGSVDDAIGADLFQNLARVMKIKEEGPHHAPSKKFTFQILP